MTFGGVGTLRLRDAIEAFRLLPETLAIPLVAKRVDGAARQQVFLLRSWLDLAELGGSLDASAPFLFQAYVKSSHSNAGKKRLRRLPSRVEVWQR